MVYYLAKIGEKAGYAIDIARDEYDKLYDGKGLASQLGLKAVKLKDVTKNQETRINRIDVVWHDGNNIFAEFEVEHSTSIVDAVVRGSNIKSQDVLRVMVIPEEREDLVYRRFNEPAMQSMMTNMEWKVVTYKLLEAYYNQNKHKKEVSIDEFLAKTRKPISKEEKDKTSQRKLFDE